MIKKITILIMSIVLTISFTTIYSSAEIVVIESNGIRYEFDPETLRDWQLDSTTSFADCYWVLYDNEVDRGSDGDANGDGEINGFDCSWILQHIAGWDHSSYSYVTHGVEFSFDGADTNNDGKINLNDATLLMRYVVGWFKQGLTGTNTDYVGLDRWERLKKENDRAGLPTPSYIEWLCSMIDY